MSRAPSAAIERYLAACVQQCESAWGLPEAAGAPDGVWSQILGGPVTSAVLGERAVPMPAALPAALAVRSSDPVAGPPPALTPESSEQRWLVAVYCVSEGPLRDAASRSMAEAVAGWAAVQHWTPLCRAEIETRNGGILPALATFKADPCAREVRAQNVFTSDLSGRGLAVWAVTWEIGLCIPLPGAAAAVPQPVPRELYAGWAPETGPDHRDDYRRLDA